MSPKITIPTSDISAVRRELSRMEARGQRRFRGRSSGADKIQFARVQLGAALLEAMEHQRQRVTLELGDATEYVDEALDRIRSGERVR